MKKFLTLSFLAMVLSYASYALAPFYPNTGTVCIGSSLFVVDSLDPGGSWSSSNPSIATVSSVSSGVGSVTGVSSGVVTITYTLGSASVYGTFTVSPAPAGITGGTSPICIGSSTTLSSATSGGTWYSSSTYIATVGSASGIVTGSHAGVTNINYTVGGCPVSKSVTVVATPVAIISGPTTVCVGSTITLSDSTALGGTWSSSSTGTATVGASTGVVTGVSSGTVTISYSVTGVCGTTVATRVITVTSTTTPGTITGASTVTAGSSITLSATPSGGSWSCATTGIATVAAGVVTGVSAGVATITYTITGCSGPASSYKTVTVTPFDGISGTVNFTSGSFWGPVKVWLITFDASTNDLRAYDSMTVYSSGTSAFYQFTGVPTDTFRVKAAVIDSFSGTGTGYIPTYHDNDFYWYNALVIPHISGTADINKDIAMAIGTVTSGPGFIAGDVTTGANKGTAGAIPAQNLHVCVVNSATHQIMAQTYTDAAGHYTFSNLPVGATYYVFPDSLNYLTTAYTSISLTTANPSMTAASFTMHTISKTITPHTQSVNAVGAAASSVLAFPNPASDKIYISWNTKATEEASVVIADVAGRILYSNTVSITAGTGINTIDVSSFANGLYVVSVKTATISYSNNLQVQH